MIRKYHNLKLQINPWHHERLFPPKQDDCKTRMDTKLRIKKHRKTTAPCNGSNPFSLFVATGVKTMVVCYLNSLSCDL